MDTTETPSRPYRVEVRTDRSDWRTKSEWASYTAARYEMAIVAGIRDRCEVRMTTLSHTGEWVEIDRP